MKWNFVFFSISIVLYSCSTGDMEKVQKEKNKRDIRTEFGKDIEIYFSEQGLKKAFMVAPTLMKQQDTLNRTYFPDGINLKLYDSFGNLSSTITAKYGEQDHNANQMIARDSVLVISTNGQSLRANDMIWSPNENKLYSYGKVAIINKTEIIYGDTLIADENLKRYTIKKVSGVVQVKK